MSANNQPTTAYPLRRRGLSTAMTVLFVAVVVIVNVIVNALATRYSWYFYTTPDYSHSINGSTDDMLKDLDTGEERVKIIFCRQQEEITGDIIYNLVWQTAKQLEARYAYIDVEIVNIYLHPEKVEKYKYTLDENGEKVKTYSISRESVIFACGDNHVVQEYSSFFLLDESNVIEYYDGEEIMGAMVRYVTMEEHPLCLFTVSHGETSSSAFYTMMVCAGYEVDTIDLAVEDIPENTALVVVSNPVWDFEYAAAGTGIVSEINRLESFLAEGGSVYVSLDPYGKEKQQLEGFLARWGVKMEDSIIRDTANSLTIDGYTLVTEYAENPVATALRTDVAEATSSRVVVRSAAPLTSLEAAGVTVSPVLTASSTADAYFEGEMVDGAGSFSVATLSQKNGGKGGSVFVASSIYFGAGDVLQAIDYGNRQLTYAVFEHMTGVQAPMGATMIAFDNAMLQDLTIGEARMWTALVAVVIPVLTAGFGVVWILRRKRR